MNWKVFFLLALLLLAGCSKKQCEFTADCTAKPCFVEKCTSGDCEYTPKANCCGNKICEAPESSCNCSDCLACIGTKGHYLKYKCAGNDCMLDSARTPVTLVDDYQFNFYRIESSATLDQPYDVNRSSFQLQFALKSITPDLILPLNITSIQILDRNVLLAKNTTPVSLGSIGAIGTENLRMITGFEDLETERTLILKMDFSYIRKTPAGQVPETKTYEKSFSTKILFLDPSKAAK